MELNAPQARFFMKENAPPPRLLKENVPQTSFFLTES